MTTLIVFLLKFFKSQINIIRIHMVMSILILRQERTDEYIDKVIIII